MIIERPPFDMDLSLRLANHALHTYDPIPTIRANGGIPVYDPDFDLLAVIEDLPDCTILSFRGTQSKENWKTDLYALPNFMGIHTGFYTAFRSLNVRIIGALPYHNGSPVGPNSFNRDKALFIDGHSLGGALALEAAILYRPDAVYTFGEPRGYTYWYINRYRQFLDRLNHWRIVDREDIITHLPGLLAGFRHTGGLGLISSLGDFEINPPFQRQLAGHMRGISTDLFRICSGRLPQWVIVQNHFMMQYVLALQKAAPRYVRSPTGGRTLPAAS